MLNEQERIELDELQERVARLAELVSELERGFEREERKRDSDKWELEGKINDLERRSRSC